MNSKTAYILKISRNCHVITPRHRTEKNFIFSEWDNLHLPTVRSQRAGQSLHEALEAVEMRILCKFYSHHIFTCIVVNSYVQPRDEKFIQKH